jgi:hypothetical protein
LASTREPAGRSIVTSIEPLWPSSSERAQDVIETALGNTAEQRHLAAFETGTD